SELPVFLSLSAWIAACVLVIELIGRAHRPSRCASLLSIGGLSAYWLFSFKAGFVREDLHTLIAWQAAGIGAILYGLSRNWPQRGLVRCAVLGVLVAGGAMLMIVAPVRLGFANPDVQHNLSNIYRDILLRSSASHWSLLGKFVRDPQAWLSQANSQKQKAWLEIRKTRPLPKLTGTVDIIPSEQTAVLASGMNYRPRPVFQEYFAYTAGLIEANRAYFASADAPEWLIFSPGSIDGRYPNSADGALWPEFL